MTNISCFRTEPGMSIGDVLGMLLCHVGRNMDRWTHWDIKLKGPKLDKGRSVWSLYLPIVYVNLVLASL